MIVALLCILTVTLTSFGVEVPDSPCPEIFGYFQREVWMGHLTVPVPTSGFPVLTQVKLSIGTALPSTYVGWIQLTEEVGSVVDNIVNLKTNLINYTIYFPLPIPIPSLYEVKVNQEIVCANEEKQWGPILLEGDKYGRLTTILTLEHSFPTNPNYFEHPGHIGANALQTQNIPSEKCGHRSEFGSSELSGFGEWPWLAMIFLIHFRHLGNPRKYFEFRCAGTLLTEDHVLTTAHCVSTQVGPVPSKEVMAYFGKYDLTRFKEGHSQFRYVKEIIIHPRFLASSHSSDLAVIVLKKPVDTTFYVRAVCMWRDGPDLTPLVGQSGAVVSWGRKSLGRNRKPTILRVPIVAQEECLRSRRDYFYLTSNQTFCAGSRDGTGPCIGDSGSGLVVPRVYPDNRIVWYLRGVASLALMGKNNQTCDLSQYIVFTDVAKFTEWIDEATSKTK